MITGKQTVQATQDQWHKLAMIVMMKAGLDHVVITSEDLEKILFGTSIAVQELEDGLHLRVLNPEQAMALSGTPGTYTKFK